MSAFGPDEEEQSIVMGVDWTDKWENTYNLTFTYDLLKMKQQQDCIN